MIIYGFEKNKNLINKIVYFFRTKNMSILEVDRAFDFVFSLVAIFLFMPIMLIIALLIKMYSPEGSILFTQRRVGLDGKLFNVYKFRTMIPNAEEKLNKMMLNDVALKEEYETFRKLKNDPRIIPYIGSFLRKSSLDELPQFFNVFLGQMSIVGPRPYIEEEFSCYTHRLQLRIVTSVKPGITGYWQVIPERHDTTFESRVDTDIEYIEKKSFLLDLKIISKTFTVMVLRKGA